MKAALLMRLSAPQIYCANFLHRNGCLDAVILENGSSLVTEKAGITQILKASTKLPRLVCSPVKLAHRLWHTMNRSKYYGNRQFHHERILASDFTELDPELKIARVVTINDPQCKKWLIEYAPGVVFVFGTALIGEPLLATLQCPVINMHWGWSPNYRGEGIVSALAQSGPGALGVTVHLVNRAIDGGKILYRERPAIDKTDNFYSIGIKLAKLGTKLFERVYHDYVVTKTLRGFPQQLDDGQLYSSAYMAAHPEFYTRAWKNLKRFQRMHHA